MPLSISQKIENGAATLVVAGEVDVSNASELRDAIDAALATEPTTLEVSLAEVPYIDSTGIGVLVGGAHRAASAGSRLVVSQPQRNVSRVLTMLGVADELGVTG